MLFIKLTFYIIPHCYNAFKANMIEHIVYNHLSYIDSRAWQLQFLSTDSLIQLFI